MLLAWLATAAAECGDRVLETPGELCDDGNLTEGDGCSSDCRVEAGWKCNQDPVTVVSDQALTDDMGFAEPAWFFSSDKRLVTQLLDAGPAVYTTEAMVDEGPMAFTMRVDDPSGTGFIGWTLGLDPNEGASPSAQWLLFDWKGTDETKSCGEALEGLAISVVNGATQSSDLWCHRGTVGEIGGLDDLSRVGWIPQTTYDVTVHASSTRILVNVDGAEVLDLEGNHPTGPLGFYAFSQEEATFEIVVPEQVSVCRQEEVIVGGYTGGVCTGSTTGAAASIWATLLGLAALRRRR